MDIHGLMSRQRLESAGEPEQGSHARPMAVGDTVKAEVTSGKDGIYLLRAKDGRQFTAQSDKPLQPGQMVELTVTATRGGQPQVALSADLGVRLENYLAAMNAEVSPESKSLARELIARQTTIPKEQFAALVKAMRSFQGLGPEQAVYMLRHKIPIQADTVEGYRALSRPETQLGAKLAALLDALGGRSPSGQNMPQSAHHAPPSGQQATQMQAQTPQNMPQTGQTMPQSEPFTPQTAQNMPQGGRAAGHPQGQMTQPIQAPPQTAQPVAQSTPQPVRDAAQPQDVPPSQAQRAGQNAPRTQALPQVQGQPQTEQPQIRTASLPPQSQGAQNPAQTVSPQTAQSAPRTQTAQLQTTPPQTAPSQTIFNQTAQPAMPQTAPPSAPAQTTPPQSAQPAPQTQAPPRTQTVQPQPVPQEVRPVLPLSQPQPAPQVQAAGNGQPLPQTPPPQATPQTAHFAPTQSVPQPVHSVPQPMPPAPLSPQPQTAAQPLAQAPLTTPQPIMQAPLTTLPPPLVQTVPAAPQAQFAPPSPPSQTAPQPPQISQQPLQNPPLPSSPQMPQSAPQAQTAPQMPQSAPQAQTAPQTAQNAFSPQATQPQAPPQQQPQPLIWQQPQIPTQPPQIQTAQPQPVPQPPQPQQTPTPQAVTGQTLPQTQSAPMTPPTPLQTPSPSTAQPASLSLESTPPPTPQNVQTPQTPQTAAPAVGTGIPDLLDALFRKVLPERSSVLPRELDAKTLRRDIADLVDAVSRQAEDLPPAQRSQVNNALRELAQTLSFNERMNQPAAYMQIPIQIGNEKTTAQLYVYDNPNHKGKKIDPENATMFLSLRTLRLGPVEGLAKLIGKNVEVDFTLESEEAAGLFRQHIPELSGLLEAHGYRLGRVNAGLERKGDHPAAVERTVEEWQKRFVFDRTV